MQTLYGDSLSKKMDETAQSFYSIPGITLMEDASFSTYTIIKEKLKNAKKVVFVAGGGNNGGDALAVARLAFLDGCRNISILLSDSGKETKLRKIQRKACEKIGLSVTKEADKALKDADLIVDGLFGIGLKGDPRAPYDELIEKINKAKAYVISIDVPSGIGDDVRFSKGIKADETVCMAVPKSAVYLPQNRDLAGIINISFPFFPEGAKPESDIRLLQESDLALKKLRSDDYKKTRGSVAIIGGSGRFTGAVVLAAKAAFHAGAGLVTIFTEERLIPSISKAIPSAMVTTYDALKNLDSFDAVLCGPGMGKDHDDALLYAVDNAKTLVVDADGIRAFARLKLKAKSKCIMTPHLGEYAALLASYCPDNETDTPESWIKTLREVTSKTESTIVVKANTLWIAGKERKISVVDGQNPSLGVAGSGDVLSGIITALAAHKDDKAAENGTLLHQSAGRLAHKKFGFYSSDDLISFIGKVR